MWWHNGWLVVILALVTFASLAALTMLVYSRGSRAGARSVDELLPEHDPLQILAERFARGEVGIDDYHARQDELRVARILSLARKSS